MTNLPLQLRGPLSRLQRTTVKFYSQLQQRFAGNSLVSESWAAMGNDLTAQAESLKKLPSSFWQSLKKQEKELLHAAELILPEDTGKPTGSLQACLVETLDLEEPMILTIYALLIRRLRVEWTERALDFYIMVKAHIARLARLIQAYSGDPALSLRCAILFHNFEKEVQEPAVIETKSSKSARKKTAHKKAAKVKRSGAAALTRRARVKDTRQPARSLKKLSKRAKPLVKKIEITRRRARR
jgi:hypothetical protein